MQLVLKIACATFATHDTRKQLQASVPVGIVKLLLTYDEIPHRIPYECSICRPSQRVPVFWVVVPYVHAHCISNTRRS